MTDLETVLLWAFGFMVVMFFRERRHRDRTAVNFMTLVTQVAKKEAFLYIEDDEVKIKRLK